MSTPRVKVETWDKQTVPMERWGKDHWTTLLYLETVCVDHGGKVEAVRMRTSKHNWRLAGRIHGEINIMKKDEYPTRLIPTQAERAKYDRVDLIGGHDDWECMNDMADLGFLTFEVEDALPMDYPLQVTVEMLPLGRRYVAETRERREETGRAAPV